MKTKLQKKSVILNLSQVCPHLPFKYHSYSVIFQQQKQKGKELSDHMCWWEGVRCSRFELSESVKGIILNLYKFTSFACDCGI